MRLRQIALVAKDLAPVQALLEEVLGLQVGYRDPGVAKFGLVNVVMPVGGEFIEIVEPTRQDVSAARYLARRGGDAGYMVIIQDADCKASRDRLAAAGVRVIEEHSGGGYHFAHYHPGDFGGVLTSTDTVLGDANWREDFSDWPPCGRAWRDHLSSNAMGLAFVTIQAKDPGALARRWGELLQKPVKDNRVTLEQGEIRFVAPGDADGTGVVAMGLVMKDAEKAKAAARARGVLDREGRASIGGVAFHLLSPADAPAFASRV